MKLTRKTIAKVIVAAFLLNGCVESPYGGRVGR